MSRYKHNTADSEIPPPFSGLTGQRAGRAAVRDAEIKYPRSAAHNTSSSRSVGFSSANESGGVGLPTPEKIIGLCEVSFTGGSATDAHILERAEKISLMVVCFINGFKIYGTLFLFFFALIFCVLFNPMIKSFHFFFAFICAF